MFYDAKIVIKAKTKEYNPNGEGIKYVTKMKGNESYLTDLLCVNFLEMAIDCGLSKKDLLQHCKDNYELVLKEKESRK